MLPAPRANRSPHEVPLNLLQRPALSLLPRRGSSRRLPYRIWGYRGRGRRRYPADSRGRRLRAPWHR
jgi:hypothetical protein